jgi:hypothetical protein
MGLIGRAAILAFFGLAATHLGWTGGLFRPRGAIGRAMISSLRWLRSGGRASRGGSDRRDSAPTTPRPELLTNASSGGRTGNTVRAIG